MLPATLTKSRVLLWGAVLIFVIALQINGDSPGEVESRLVRAREELRISQATGKRFAADLEGMKASGQATPEMIRNHEIYLSRVEAMVYENQKMVEMLEAACAKHRGTLKTAGCGKAAYRDQPPPAAPLAGEERGTVEPLDGELQESLSVFDELLLKEMEEIRTRSENKSRERADGTAASGSGAEGADAGSSSDEAASGESAQEAGTDESGTERGEGKGEVEQGGSYSKVPVTDKRGAPSRSEKDRGTGERSDQPPESAQDDDIVARQLREAAEKETDPELKKKLWKEYEDYKKAGR